MAIAILAGRHFASPTGYRSRCCHLLLFAWTSLALTLPVVARRAQRLEVLHRVVRVWIEPPHRDDVVCDQVPLAGLVGGGQQLELAVNIYGQAEAPALVRVGRLPAASAAAPTVAGEDQRAHALPGPAGAAPRRPPGAPPPAAPARAGARSAPC